ncbi:MAG: hypothetical protein FJ146_08835 [Deltaproteobacteria bacterium]|nr:hypothetical protein [Deltaproteobacteria bacterium]
MSKISVIGLALTLAAATGCKASVHQSSLETVRESPPGVSTSPGAALSLVDSQSALRGAKNFADWYLRHTAGEKSAKAMGPLKPALEKNELAPTAASRTQPYCHDGEEAQPLDCAILPRPTATDITNMAAAVRLGKALFWDMQVGSDGKTACASCHFQAGADARTLNALHPGPDGVFASGGVNGPGQQFRKSSITNDDRIGSQGVENALFRRLPTKITDAKDDCQLVAEHPFGSHRAVTGRNTPTVIGAIFNVENFWDGRASTDFNGFDPFGQSANAGEKLVLATNASLASQAVGPVNNAVEMACAGRQFNGPQSVAAKMLVRPVLQFQVVSRSDSALGSMSASPAKGLRCGRKACTYQDLITAAFRPEIARDALSHFSRIWGQAVMAYEATLVPNDTPMDRYLRGQTKALTVAQQRGLKLFNGKARCYECHSGPELSDASYTYLFREGPLNDDGADQGYHNLGVRPTEEDLGRASVGPGGATFARSNSRFNRGAFKTPMLRNIKLTAPYFHNGGIASLGELVDFYARGGDFPNAEKTSELEPFYLTRAEKAELVDFLTNGLTDCRVERERAPFDHPSLVIPGGPTLKETGTLGLGKCP